MNIDESGIKLKCVDKWIMYKNDKWKQKHPKCPIHVKNVWNIACGVSKNLQKQKNHMLISAENECNFSVRETNDVYYIRIIKSVYTFTIRVQLVFLW